jgi:hypothetical protein
MVAFWSLLANGAGFAAVWRPAVADHIGVHVHASRARTVHARISITAWRSNVMRVRAYGGARYGKSTRTHVTAARSTAMLR